MAQWFYAEGPNRNIGPLSAQDIGDALRRGLITADTPVWREGMAQWQALRNVATELGVQALLAGGAPAVRAPPPLPHNAGYAARPAYAGAARPAPASSGMGRGAIIALVCVIGGIGLIMVLAILAAIALPAYNDYTTRAKLMQANQAATELRPAIAAQWADGVCPSNESPGFQAADAYASPLVESITVGEFEDGSCGMELRPRGIRDQIDGKAVWWSMEPRTQQWKCSSEIDDRYLPVDCRG